MRRYYAIQYSPQQTKRNRPSVLAYDDNNGVLMLTLNGVLMLTLGSQSGCDAKTDPTKFCNGPLRPGQQYRYVVKIFIK